MEVEAAKYMYSAVAAAAVLTPLNCAHKHGRCRLLGMRNGECRRASKWWSMNYLHAGSPVRGRIGATCVYDEPNQIPARRRAIMPSASRHNW